MSNFFEIIPLLGFFVTFLSYGLNPAIICLIVLTAIVQGVNFFWYKNVDKKQLVILAITVVFGSFTVFLQDPFFFKIKVTVVSWIFSVVLLINTLSGKSLIVQMLAGEYIKANKKAWINTNIAWSLFFFFQGIVNLFVLHYFPTSIWVYYKVFGILVLQIVFLIINIIYLSKNQS